MIRAYNHSMPSMSAKNYHDLPKNPQYAHAVPEDVYRELAELARIECEYTDRESVRINVECERGTTLYALELDAELYFKTYKEIWGNSTCLTAIVPTWCELHTYDDEGTETLNDFATKKFNQLFKAIY